MEKVKKTVPFILPFVIYAFPAVFLYANNVREAELSDMLPAMLALVGIGYVIFAAALCVYRKVMAAALFSAVFGLVMLNYAFVEKLAHRLLPLMRIWQLVPIIAVSIAVAVYFLCCKNSSLAKTATLLTTICFAALIVINLATALPTEISKLSHAEAGTVADSVKLSAKQDRPNIYYILMDEYASFYQTEQYLGYVNEPMQSIFDKNGFNVSYTSFNEANSTEIVMTNALALDYVVDGSTTHAEMLEMRREGDLHKLLNKAGYTERGVGSTGWLGIKSETVLEGGTAVTTAAGDGFWDLLIKNTVLYDANAIASHAQNVLELIQDSLVALKTLARSPNSSVFTMYYICSPHEPFFFKSDGTINMAGDYAGDSGKTTDAYVQQLQYITTRIGEAVSDIIDKDPGGIIILCSDHGLRGTDVTPEGEDRRILNGLYYQGEAFDIEGKSTVNTLRSVLSRLLDIQLEDKEVLYNE